MRMTMSRHKSKVVIVKDPALPSDLGAMNLFGKSDVDSSKVIQKIENMISTSIEIALGRDLRFVLDDVKRKKGGQPINLVIKVNLTQAALPTSVNTTDPRLVRALCQYLQRVSPPDTKIKIVDNSSYGPTGCTRRAFEISGIKQAVLATGLSEENIVPLDEGSFTLISCNEIHDGLGEFLSLEQVAVFDTILDADYIINVPKMKTQLDELVSLGLKNWQGIIPHDKLNEWGAKHTIGQQDAMSQQGHHRTDLPSKIVDLHRIVPCDLVIVDGLWGMEGQGPWEGSPVKMDVVITGTDVVAVDATATRCMGIDPLNEVVHIRVAHTIGLGNADEAKIEVVGTPISECTKHFKRPSYNPVGYIPEIKVHVGGTCIGCMATVRAFLDTLKRRDRDPNDEFSFEKLKKVVGEVHIVAGLDVPFATKQLDGLVLLVGDCPFLKSDVIPAYQISVVEKVKSRLGPSAKVKMYRGCNPATAMVECEKLLDNVANGRVDLDAVDLSE